MPKKHSKAPSTTGDHTRTSKKASRPPSPKPCADNEVRYASPGAAKRAFRMERESNPKYRRCPTPHVSQSRRVGSRASLGTAFTGGESGSGGSGNLSAETVTPFTGGLERYDPNDNVEIISGPLGRKEPKHRTLLPGMLRPALRSATRLPQDFGPPPPPNASKPLPSRPMSVINSGFDSLMRMTSRSAPLARSQSRSSIHPSPPVDQRANPISNLFSSLSLGTPSPRYHRSRELITPADNLNDYLRLASVPTWDRWPEGADDSKWAMFGGGSSNAAWKNTGVGWEWMRRLEDSEKERMRGRALKIWEGPDRYWEKEIIDFHETNVPRHSILPANRWGSQIFALHASGYDTVEFYDEDADASEDLGLLSWLNGSVLQTAISALHMLRHSSNTFAFHVIPSPRPAAMHSQSRISDASTCLWDGFGTMVLVNRSDELDRAMILSVRPPSIVTGNVLREFSRDGRAAGREGWRHLARELAEGDIGQANLLQAQIYDDCVRNQVFFFVVTNLRQWVFGSFNSTYTKASVGPVVERKSRDPSAMQCLTAWLVKSFDARPRDLRQPHHHEHDRQGHRVRRSSSRGSLRHRSSRDHHHYDAAPPYPGLPRARTPSQRPSMDEFSDGYSSDRHRHASAPPQRVNEWGFQPQQSPAFPVDPYYNARYASTPTPYNNMSPAQYPAWVGYDMYQAHATQPMYSAGQPQGSYPGYWS